MKSQGTMLNIVRQKALAKGIRAHSGYVGVLATSDEIRQIYAAETFNVAPGRKVHKKHILNWELIGEAFAYKMDLDKDEPFVVFFDIPISMMSEVNRFLQQHLMTSERVIYAVQWPALVEKGLMTIEEMEDES